MTNPCIDQAAWPRLSPLLDELLDLAPAARDARLAALRHTDPTLADHLAALLDSLPPLEAGGFLAAPALPPPAGLGGQAVGAYQLQHEIGRGGMGSVWLAQRADGRFTGQAAIKFMHGGLATPGAAARFLREGQLLGGLDHPNIAKLLDAGVRQVAGTAPGQPYLVLEYVEGQPIDRHCEARGLDTTARVRLVLAVAAAVAHAHSRLVLHRDLKPSNILVTADGRPKLLDFGIGKLLARADPGPAAAGPGPSADTTELTQRAFTTRYAAPEQVQHQAVTTATDVYALGVLLHELLGGGHPTERPGGTPLAQMQAVVDVVPGRLSDTVRRLGGAGAARRARALQGDLDTIVARALKKDPAERYANAAALAEDLRRWLDHEPVLAQRDSATYRAGRFLRRHLRVVLAAGTAGTLALAGGAAAALWQAHQARSERSQAEALVEFMLGDLQRKVSQLGRADLLQSVGDKAMAYFADKDLQAMDSEALARHARALQVVGESARQRLDLAQARRAFEQATATTGRLLALAPNDLDRLQEHASSLERMVDLVARMGVGDSSLALAWQLSGVRWRAAHQAPQDPALRLQALMADQWPASLLVATTATAPEGLALLARVQEGLQALPPGLPALPRARSITVLLVGQAQAATGRYAQATENMRAFLAMQPDQHDAVADVWERRENLMGMRMLARTLLDQGQLAPAAEVAMQAVQRGDSDALRSPGNLILAEELILNRALLAEVLWLGGDEQQAREQADLIDAAVASAGQVPADNIDWQVSTLGRVLALRARLQPRPEAAWPAGSRWRAALQTQTDLAARLESQGNMMQGSRRLATLATRLALGDAWLAEGRRDTARQHWHTVADQALPEAQAGSHLAMRHLALALLRLGRPAEARPWVERLQASAWRHPDLADLQRRLAQAEGGPVLASRR